ncbi:2-oxoacid:acceptor oxidoreductase family protein [Clostridium sp. JN-9]|uniref:2-oxoacid:acceptor oxidoreductase family protein n=1 Tax=Clostridium sp. JN-9 TaxID=2507159 RepID=UPI000FFE2E68|nr:2-oxoacid:acceptor oxidoreductase family protein [Clostridium sp. JN-9]QAT41325.1 2-oxoacid:ferredoxin oxidoreductase subunit gamma [Clostridium sp. JN-9]
MASQELIFAGFGGQGILSMGKFLAYAGMDADLNVSWLPSYGPEMRGGTANCSVILTNESIGSPIVTKADTLIVMNRPSLDKFEEAVNSGGLIVMDSDLVDRMPVRNDLEIIAIPAQTIAEKMGSKKIANMILLGALVKKTGIVSTDQLLDALKAHGKESFFDINKEAIEKGMEFVS